jgi:hypothetical protein
VTVIEGQIPASPERPLTLRDSARLTNWVRLLLCCWMAVALIAFASHWALLQFLEDMQQGVYPSRSAAIQHAAVLDQIVRLVRFGGIALFLLTAIFFLRWVYRANENARRLGAVDMHFTPGWAIGWYFMPIANLAMPYHVMKEIWNASVSPADWRSLRGPTIVVVWWWLFLAWNLIGYVVLIAGSLARGSVTGSIFVAQLLLVFDASALAAGIAAFLLITRVRAIQVARASST